MSSDWISTCPVVCLEICNREERFLALCLTSNKYTIKEGWFKSPWKPCWGQAFVTHAAAAAARRWWWWYPALRGWVSRWRFLLWWYDDARRHGSPWGWSPRPLWNCQGPGECRSKLETRPFCCAHPSGWLTKTLIFVISTHCLISGFILMNF